MPGASDYLESGILNHIFRTDSFAKPLTLAICLCTGTITDTMTGGLGSNEVANAGGYARQLLAPLNANWAFVNQVSDSGNLDNVTDITFPTATANWGTITYVAITDSGVYGAGNMLFSAPLTVNKTVTNGDTFKFTAGNLDIYLS